MIWKAKLIRLIKTEGTPRNVLRYALVCLVIATFVTLGRRAERLRRHFTLETQLPIVCSNDNCRVNYVQYFRIPGARPIPAIRHILWKNESVSKYFADQLLTWVRIHPDWTYVLWRDEDMEVFVANNFPTFLLKFKSLPMYIMRVDAFRYMLLFKYGGVYADLDYTLVKSLNEFRRFHAVITREPEAHSIEFLGMSWPLRPFANTAFMMSAPGHRFFLFSIEKLKYRVAESPLQYAGPYGLSEMLMDYQTHFAVTDSAMEAVYIPPSYSFYPYPENRLNTSRSYHLSVRMSEISKVCGSPQSYYSAIVDPRHPNVTEYCNDITNMDPITDKSPPVFAIHDLKKTGALYNGEGIRFYTEDLVDMRNLIRNLKYGSNLL